MPITYLDAFLECKDVEAGLNHVDFSAAPVRLVIDANEYLRVIIRKHRSYALPIAVGEYGLLAKLIATETRLLLRRGACLQFVFDSPRKRHPQTTALSPYRRIEAISNRNEQQNLVFACQNGYSKKDLPLPLLAVEQLLDTLRSLSDLGRIFIFTNDRFADIVQCVVDVCDRRDECHAERSIILSDDNTYFAFEGCECIKYDIIISVPNEVVVFSRATLAAALDLTESQFVEFCLSLGNQFIPSSLSAESEKAANDLLLSIKTQLDPPYKLQHSDADSETSIEFCRQLFNGAHDAAMALLEADYAECHVDHQPENLLALSEAAEDAVMHLLEIEDCSDFSTVAGYLSTIYPYVTPLQQEALISTMHTLASLQVDEDKVAMSKDDAGFVMPSWENVLSSLYCQLIYRAWRESVSGIKVPPPSCLFSCEQFIAILKRGPITVPPLTKALPTIDHGFGGGQNSGRNSADPLPIDAHREAILRKVAVDRVVMIHGETGCGKSTRLPIFLYEDCLTRGAKCKILIAQPRRIAAMNVYKRLKMAIGENSVGLRMGQGVRKGENCPITIATTGKLLRYLSRNLLQSYTHIIVDEVHERSMDNDLTCLFVREMLLTNSKMKVILMSATIQYSMYQNYFGAYGDFGDMKCLSVGVRRFPVEIIYAEEIGNAGRKLVDTLYSFRGEFDDTKAGLLARRQYAVVDYIVRNRIEMGTGVLVFVAGMQDINELFGFFEESLVCVWKGGRRSNEKKFKVFAIHKDIPLEEQEEAFLPVQSDEIKVIIATNAAESSITITDVDVVIDMGIQKSVFFDQNRHRRFLRSTWISKASATQRAGRTGRTRAGVVYRLYSRECFAALDEHPTTEVKRIPMQDVIIHLRSDFEESFSFKGVVPILQKMIEAPSLENITKSFQHLFQRGMITEGSDEGRLTNLGSFCSGLSVDVQLGKLIALGVLFGVMEEAVILSSALSLQKSLFRVASPFVQRSPDDLNNVVVNNFLAATVLDDGCYSEPIMYLRLLLLFEEQPKDRRAGWISKHSISYIRFLHFRTSTFDCMRRVRRLLHNSSFRANKLSDINDGDITIKSSDIGNEKLNMLRLLLTWTCDENIMKQESSTLKMDQSPEEVVIMSPEFKEDHLRELLPKAITWSVRGSGSARIVQFLTDSNEAQNSATYSPLIRDVKEGVRILNALRGTHRDGVMFRRLPADDDNKAVVGSREWSRAKRDQSSTDDYFELKCKILNPKWIFMASRPLVAVVVLSFCPSNL